MRTGPSVGFPSAEVEAAEVEAMAQAVHIFLCSADTLLGNATLLGGGYMVWKRRKKRK